MAQVFDFGQFEREDTLANQLSEALSTGLEQGSRIAQTRVLREQTAREAGAAEETARLNREKFALEQKKATATQEERKSSRKLERDKLDFEKSKQENVDIKARREGAGQIQESISKQLLQMNEASKGIFLQSDEYKELVKVVKKGAPELVDEQGQIRVIPRENLIEKTMEDVKVGLLQKVQAGGKLTPGEQITLELLFDENVDEDIFKALAQDPGFGSMLRTTEVSDEEKIVQLRKIVDVVKQGIFNKAKRGNQFTDTLGGNPTDPLGLLGER